ncbi:MAG: M23 family metallopeptidase [Alphaproteobacteria bacterium]|nr:M23 family metallopeptidase [Alphaproteobacteria bacterium]
MASERIRSWATRTCIAAATIAAPTGAPIVAAGNGTVDLAGPNGAYGTYVRIQHSSSFATAYAHLSGIAPGIRKGRAVRQGQVIGYVGATGLATGPHLHYEVMVGNNQVNPLSVKFAGADKLAGKELAQLRAHINEVDARVVAQRPLIAIATRN